MSFDNLLEAADKLTQARAALKFIKHASTNKSEASLIIGCSSFPLRDHVRTHCTNIVIAHYENLVRKAEGGLITAVLNSGFDHLPSDATHAKDN